jgi:hypothetical protein
MKAYRSFVLSLGVAALATAVAAQELPFPPPPPLEDQLTFSWSAADGQGATFTQAIPVDPVGLVAMEPFEKPQAVTGAPYSAEAVTEVTQTLADGNRIQRRTTAKVYRDSQGRIRREQQMVALGGLVAESENTIVTISDPVNGTFVTFHVGDKTAMKSQRKFNVAAERMAAGKFGVAMGAAGAGVAGPMGFSAYAAKDPNLSVDTQSLGTQTIEGVQAEGTKTTTTIPAGAIGNELPIEMVAERWYSPELQVVVMTSRTDPRFGETVYRLTNIVRGEPAASLFQIPEDMKIEEPKRVPPRPGKPEGR